MFWYVSAHYTIKSCTTNHRVHIQLENIEQLLQRFFFTSTAWAYGIVSLVLCNTFTKSMTVNVKAVPPNRVANRSEFHRTYPEFEPIFSFCFPRPLSGGQMSWIFIFSTSHLINYCYKYCLSRCRISWIFVTVFII